MDRSVAKLLKRSPLPPAPRLAPTALKAVKSARATNAPLLRKVEEARLLKDPPPHDSMFPEPVRPDPDNLWGQGGYDRVVENQRRWAEGIPGLKGPFSGITIEPEPPDRSFPVPVQYEDNLGPLQTYVTDTGETMILPSHYRVPDTWVPVGRPVLPSDPAYEDTFDSPDFYSNVPYYDPGALASAGVLAPIGQPVSMASDQVRMAEEMGVPVPISYGPPPDTNDRRREMLTPYERALALMGVPY
jgi:hypothetical protein